MAATRALSNIVVGTNSTYQSIDLLTNSNFYIIGIKGTSKATGDTVDPKDIISIAFELAVDSGESNKYITVGRTILNFNVESSLDKAFNEKSAYNLISRFTPKFYIRPISMETVEGTVTEGQASVSIYINSFSL